MKKDSIKLRKYKKAKSCGYLSKNKKTKKTKNLSKNMYTKKYKKARGSAWGSNKCPDDWRCENEHCQQSHSQRSKWDCKFGRKCQDEHCKFWHPDGRDRDCPDDRNCTNKDCKYWHHPHGKFMDINCRYGEDCRNKAECPYKHPPPPQPKPTAYNISVSPEGLSYSGERQGNKHPVHHELLRVSLGYFWDISELRERSSGEVGYGRNQHNSLTLRRQLSVNGQVSERIIEELRETFPDSQEVFKAILPEYYDAKFKFKPEGHLIIEIFYLEKKIGHFTFHTGSSHKTPHSMVSTIHYKDER